MANEIVQVMVNPFQLERQEQSSSTAIEQSRAVAEVQSRLAIAQRFPRDQGAAWARIQQACKRPGLAEVAMYQYPRGGQTVRGPSIRLAEELVRSWGNMDTGWAEISRGQDSSEVEAYCWDLETNTRTSIRFTVGHYRDTKKGPQRLTEEREIYELIANVASRRRRSTIIAAIPKDVIDDAVATCAQTIASGGNGGSIQDRAKKLVSYFDVIGVTIPTLVSYLGHPIDQINADELVTLRGIYQSMRDGQSKADDWFKKARAVSSLDAAAGLTKEPDRKKPSNIDQLTAELADCPDAATVYQVRDQWARDFDTTPEWEAMLAAIHERLQALK